MYTQLEDQPSTVSTAEAYRHPYVTTQFSEMENLFTTIGDFTHPLFDVAPICRVTSEHEGLRFDYAVDKSFKGDVTFSNEKNEIKLFSAMYEAMQKGDIAEAQKNLSRAAAFKVPDVVISQDSSFRKYLKYLDYLFVESLHSSSRVVLVDPEPFIINLMDKKNFNYEIVFCKGLSRYNYNRYKSLSIYSRTKIYKPHQAYKFAEDYYESGFLLYFGIGGTMYELSTFKSYFSYALQPLHPLAAEHGVSYENDGNGYYDILLSGYVYPEDNEDLPTFDIKDIPAVSPSKHKYSMSHLKYVGMYRVFTSTIEHSYAFEEAANSTVPDMWVCDELGPIQEHEVLLDEFPTKVKFIGEVIYDIKFSATFGEKKKIADRNGYKFAWIPMLEASQTSFYSKVVSPHFNAIYTLPVGCASPVPAPKSFYRFREETRVARSHFADVMERNSGNRVIRVAKAKSPRFGYWKEIYIKGKNQELVLESQSYKLLVPDPSGNITKSYTRLVDDLMQDTGWCLTFPTNVEVSSLRHYSWYNRNDGTYDLGNWNVAFHGFSFTRYAVGMEWELDK